MEPWVIVAIVAAVAAFGYHVYQQSIAPDLVCTRCGTVGQGDYEAGGSNAAAVILWIIGIVALLFFAWWVIVIPILYSLFRGSKRVCAACSAEALVPANTPVGREIISKHAEKKNERKPEEKQQQPGSFDQYLG